MSRLVTRDPVSREELHVRRVTYTGRRCGWCGNIRQTKDRLWLYQFEVQTDAGRIFQDKNVFCSRKCRECYR